MRRLLIRPGAIGDCILSLPALRHLATDYTEVWVPSAVAPLITFADKVRALASTSLDLVGVGDLEMPQTLVQTLKSFDSVVSWYGSNRPEFREALLKVGVPCQFHAALPPPDYSGHAVDFFSSQVGAPAGLVPRIDIAPAVDRGSVVIQPFSGSARKNWPLEHYRELAARLKSRVEWTAGPEEPLSAAVRFKSLGDLAHWLTGARLYIGNDSGITHLTAALNVRTIALFGPSPAEKWCPRGDNVTVLRCNPIERLPVETVLAAVRNAGIS